MHFSFIRIISLLACICWIHGTLASDGFVKNEGQWDGPFEFKADIPGGAVFLESKAITFHLIDPTYYEGMHNRNLPASGRVAHHAFKLHFEGANKVEHFETKDESTSYNNYFLGNDPNRWKSQIHPVKTVIYKDLYDGIDLWVTYNDRSMKYEFHVSPGVDPNAIKIRTEGLDDMVLDRDKNLVLRTSLSDVMEKRPIAYQTKSDRRFEVDAEFRIEGNYIHYNLGKIDPNLPLIIDPEVVFSTYSGSSSNNWGFTATPDKEGNLYAGGIVFGSAYPITSGAFDQDYNQGEHDVAITKYDKTGAFLIYSTFLGGNGSEEPHSMIVNDFGVLYVMGTTGSKNFPVSSKAYDDSFNGGPTINLFSSFDEGVDMFVTAFNIGGTGLIGSTFLGGDDTDGLNTSNGNTLTYNYSDEFRGEINLDDEGDVYIASCTKSDDFPHTSSSFGPSSKGQLDAVVVKMNPTLSNIRWGGFLGGSNHDAAYAIDVAKDGSVYVAGGTRSSNFPSIGNPLYPTFGGGEADGFITRISADGSALLASTYYGSAAYDQIQFLQLDRQGKPHFYGQTEHAGDDLIFNANFNDVGGGQILGVLEPDLSARIWTTQFGSTPGRPNISPTAFLVDVCNSVYISGWGGELNQTTSNHASNVAGLDVTNDAFQSTPDNQAGDFYLAVVSSDGNSLVFGSFYGGQFSDDHVDGGTSRFDRGGKIYHSVCASCFGLNDFPIVPDPGAWAAVNKSDECCNAVFKIDFELPIVVADFNIPSFACAPYTLSIKNNSVTQTNTSFLWDFGNGNSSSATNPTVTYNEKGTYDISLIVWDPTSCNEYDTLVRTITIAEDTNYVLPSVERCLGQPAVLGPDPSDYINYPGVTFSWQPPGPLDNPNSLNPTALVNKTTTFRLVVDYGGCQERILQDVLIDLYPLNVTDDTIVCSTFSPFYIKGTAFGEAESFEWSLDSDFSQIIGTDSTLLVDNLPDALNYFYFRSTKSNGCQMIDTVLITVSDKDIELTADTVICKNVPFELTAVSQNPKNEFTYIWTLDDYSTDTADGIVNTNQNFILIELDTAQTFYLTALSKKVEGCMAQDFAQIDVSNLEPSNVLAFAEQDTFYRGELIQLHGEPSGEGVSFSWSPTKYMTDSLSADPMVRPKEKTNYIWTVSDDNAPQCTFTDTITVSPYEILCDTPEIYIPTAFSPNNDGINDELLVYGRYIESMQLIIHDRWGNEVFRTTDQTIGWDGTFKGKPADRAVYVYQLEATCVTRDVFQAKGNITLHD